MADLTYYAAKIAECLRLLETSNDPLYRDVYQAMADEFAEKYATLSRHQVEQSAAGAPPSPLLGRPAPGAAMHSPHVNVQARPDSRAQAAAGPERSPALRRR